MRLSFAAALLAFSSVLCLNGAETTTWRAGIAAVKITPDPPVRMSGYAARTKPFEKVEMDIYAKALALDDGAGTKAVLITTDLVGLSAAITDKAALGLKEKRGLDRPQILFSVSHNHAGPTLSLDPKPSEGVSIENAARTEAYTRKLIERLVSVAEQALDKLEPATLTFGTGIAHFAMNRREFTSKGVILGVNPRGRVDRTVPVLKIESAHGQLRAIVLSYACHNTTLGQDNYALCGDYAGFAQATIQEKFPGAQAMFMIGCGADANPYPRGKMEDARQNGTELSNEVARVIRTQLKPINGPLRLAYDHVDLPLQKRSRAELEKLAAGNDSLSRGTARGLLSKLDRGEQLRESYRAPIAVWQFGADLTLVALSSEVVSDYVPMIEKAIGPLQLWPVAYCNDYFGYIPSPRMIEEGGYETRGLFSGDGWFSPETAPALVNKVRELAQRVGR